MALAEDGITLSKVPWYINAKGGQYKEARLSRDPFAVDAALWSDSQTAGRFDSSSKLRNAITELGCSLE